jgi:hypothetical protein
MVSIGVLPHVVEAVVNHVSGHKAGVAGIYNRATYANEKRDALGRWDAHLGRRVGAPGRGPQAAAGHSQTLRCAEEG